MERSIDPTIGPSLASRRRASRYQPLAPILAAVCLGIAADRVFPLAGEIWCLLSTSAAVAWWIAWTTGRLKIACCLLLLALACAAGGWRHIHWHRFAENEIGAYAHEEPQSVCVRAVALAAPRFKPAPPPSPLFVYQQGEQSRLPVRLTHLQHGANWETVSGKATLFVDGHLLGVFAGDHLQILAKLSAPQRPRNPGEFDFARHLRKDRQLCRLSCPAPESVAVIERGSPWAPRRWLDQLRRQGDDLLWRHIAPQRAPLASAILLGQREQLDQERKADFFLTGTVHLLAISGLHVGILAGAIWWAAGATMLSRRQSLLFVAGGVILYAVLTDARPPVVRAAILTTVACAASWWGRRPLSFNSLSAAALVVLAINPEDLFQAGVQLSFLAVATLSVCAPLLLPHPPRDPLDRLIAQSWPWPLRAAKGCWSWIWRMWLAGALIWLIALPLVLHHFHLAAPVGVLLNPLLWVPVCVALLTGLGVLVCGGLIPPVAMVLGWCCDTSLAFIELCVAAMRDVPGGRWWMAAPPIWWTAGFYVALAAVAAAPHRLAPVRWRWALLLGWIAVGLFAAENPTRHLASAPLRCTFLAVGHGAGVVVEMPGGQTLLYDAGRLGPPSKVAHIIAGFLWTRGVKHLDAVVLSHADADHYNALPELLQYVSVGVVYVSPLMFQHENDALRELRLAIEQAGVPLREIHRGDRLNLSAPLQIEVWHPPAEGVATVRPAQRDNANSIVLNVEYAGRRIILPGDLEAAGLQEVLADDGAPCDVLMAPHHGSLRSDPQAVAAWCSPQWVIISAGRQDVRQTKAIYQQAGAHVLHTAQEGAVQVTIAPRDKASKAAPGDIRVTSWLGGESPSFQDHGRAPNR